MRNLKVLLVFLIGLAAVIWILRWKGSSSFVFAWTLNFILMMVMLFYTETLKPKLNCAYFDTRAWEQAGNAYRYVGVHMFRKILIWTGWERLNKQANPVGKKKELLKQLEYRTRVSEFGHVVIFVVVSLVAVVVAWLHGLQGSVWLIATNILLNLYPVIVQRYNRPRYQKILSKISRNPEASVSV
ncbi:MULTISPECIES: hypothetical protein [Gammaproteobacteria]|uniref:glycosyl-4,4'-diaponeurosporenoate acyltransferase CrtO family protein n=1 Tax=Gammaproteobacteria TaxID=1236 RepID=UPI000DCF9E9B|nr:MULTISPECIES: hypothetical protein [Gammaproteobacteria]RTE86293.1 hypothetical protein DQX04_06905 [Aliidiomarina sp. B3213]TCZ91644.1 hypothetical protein EYQ95_06915 [Lysobacter sp. N42]